MSEQLLDIIRKEKELDLYRETIVGVPFWRIVRAYVREKQTASLSNYKGARIPYLSIMNGMVAVFSKIVNIFCTKKQYENIVIAFPRLHNVNGQYIDKITDPLILLSGIKNSCIIFQYKNRRPRINEGLSVNMDMLDAVSRLFAFLLLPFVFLSTFSRIYRVYKRASSFFNLTKKDLFIFFKETSLFVARHFYFTLFLKRIKPKRIFYAGRRMFNPMIAAGKKLGIVCYEAQHGVTFGETVTYSGDYDPRIDPDYFLTFGETWKGPQFGIPVDRIINIGWAYRDFLLKANIKKEIYENTVLFLSDPDISKSIVATMCEFSSIYPQYNYHLRVHPLEQLSPEQITLLSMHPNIKITNNEEESSIAILSYNKIVGVNSSVLFEALSVGISVGRLQCNGFNPLILKEYDIDGFYDITDIDKFNMFMNFNNKDNFAKNNFYSKFSPDIIDSLQ
jgi:hypothetical protein